MKTLTTILFLLLTVIAQARTFYFSSSGGSDSYTSTQAQSSATPWASLTKLNASMSTFAAGDTIAFKKGDTFYGSIRWGTSNGQGAKNGTSTAPYVFTSYGSGALPIISGFTTVTGWTNISGNIWESTSAVTGGLSTCEMVVIDNEMQPKGRFPNLGASGTGLQNGYYLIDSHSGSTSFTDASNPTSGTDWDGAKAVVRLNAWRIQIVPITSHSGTTFTATAMQTYTDGYGYFITDHQSTLDAQGEWYYNTSTKKLRIYTTTNPSSLTIKAATQDTVMQFYDDDWIVLDGLQIEGANKWATYHYSAANNTVKNCHVRFAGENGITATNSATTSFTATNNIVERCGDYGINVKGSGNGQTISYNYVDSVGVWAQNGVKRDPTQHSIGICNNGSSGHYYGYNTIKYVGYVPMRSVGGTSPVEYNYIDYGLFVADDGGGIYTAGSGSSTGKVIRGNLIRRMIGAPDGRNGNVTAVGIYIEDGSQNYEIYNNYVLDIGEYGFYVHNAVNINAHDNLFYNCGEGAGIFKHDNSAFPDIAQLQLKRNIFFLARDNDPHAVMFWSRDATQLDFGTASGIDSNYYCRPIAASTDSLIYGIAYLFNQIGTEVRSQYTLAEWQAYSGWDTHTQTAPITYSYNSTSTDDVILALYNTGTTDSVVTLSQSYRDAKNQIYYAGPLTIPARSAIVLMESSDTPPASSTQPIYYKNGSRYLKNGNKRIRQ
jgi:hypothetical protein